MYRDPSPSDHYPDELFIRDKLAEKEGVVRSEHERMLPYAKLGAYAEGNHRIAAKKKHSAE